MAYDSNLWLTGNTTTCGETINSANFMTASGTRVGTQIHPGLTYRVELYVGAATSPATNFNPTIELSTQTGLASQTGWTTMAQLKATTVCGKPQPNPDAATAQAVMKPLLYAFEAPMVTNSTASMWARLAWTANTTQTTQTYGDVQVRLIPLSNQSGLGGANF